MNKNKKIPVNILWEIVGRIFEVVFNGILETLRELGWINLVKNSCWDQKRIAGGVSKEIHEEFQIYFEKKKLLPLPNYSLKKINK